MKKKEDKCPSCMYQPPKEKEGQDDCPSCFYDTKPKETDDEDQCPSCFYNGLNRAKETKEK